MGTSFKILTAYRAGGVYKEQHIERLRKQVESQGYELTCINGEYPHWWCKISIFDVEGPVLYFDLDTTIVDDISPLVEAAKKERFIMLKDFNIEGPASGVMAWNGDMSHIHDEFKTDPEGFMNQYTGDQDFLGDGGHCPTFWQDILPNHIQSYKVHVKRNGIHSDCRVVCFHGNPRPWAINELVKE